jgi:hypothetical protein
VIFGAPALRRLIALKFRGALRRQTRKLRSLSGFLFATIGLLLTCGWLATLLVGRQAFETVPLTREEILPLAQFGIFVLGALSLITAASVRGVYMPQEDIERLFAAPVKRSDILRYRMLVDLGRGLFGSLVLGAVTVHRMPNPLFGVIGIMLTVLTMGILRQFFSLLLAGAGKRVDQFLRGRSLLFVRILIGVGVWGLVMLVVMGEQFFTKLFGDVRVVGGLEELVAHPVAQGILAPTLPWARMMTAADWPEFLKWTGACFLIGIALFEVTAQMRIDYREMALETSDRIAARLRQVRRGGIFSGGKASNRTTGWRLPKIFGRGPTGAVAWIKWVSMIRKARGTLLIGLLIVVGVSVGVTYMLRGEEGGSQKESLLGTALISVIGITYLCGALRFDFRADLDRMVQIKAWPVAPRRIFFGSLLPVVALISAMLGWAIWFRLAWLGLHNPIAEAIPVVLPFLTFAWLAVENIVYLFAPIRYVPGQEGSLHHTGRAIVLVLLRIFLMFVIAILVGLAAAGVYWIGGEYLGLGESQSAWCAFAAGLLVLLLVNYGLCCAGGRMLAQFDVARDQG